MKYLHLFETETAFNSTYNGEGYEEPWVSYTEEAERVNYNKTEEQKLLETPLTFEITSNGNITWKAYSTAYTLSIDYKKNNGEWTEITAATGNSAPTISVSSGDTVQFRGNNDRYCGSDGYFPNAGAGFLTTCSFRLSGNIMSLISKDNFASLDDFNLIEADCSDAFAYLFKDCTELTSAGDLLLPANNVPYCGYYGMFQGCTSLTTAPALPATTLWGGWTYNQMFRGCTSLTTAPILPVTTLPGGGYGGMFSGCTSLTGITCLATDISGGDCTADWVAGVASSGTFAKAASMSSWTTGANGIPTNWTVVDAS